eukprot:jgi/Mesen1/1084/ME000123S00252
MTSPNSKDDHEQHTTSTSDYPSIEVKNSHERSDSLAGSNKSTDGSSGSGDGGCLLPPFLPYTATVPWHSGPRALFSRLFPKYGHYCGPNYSSGREGGSLHWEKEPLDVVDYCCYRHDIGYDTESQAGLLKADEQLLKCLENAPLIASKRGEPSLSQAAEAYRVICIFGLRRFLIPYRTLTARQEQDYLLKVADKRRPDSPASRALKDSNEVLGDAEQQGLPPPAGLPLSNSGLGQRQSAASIGLQEHSWPSAQEKEGR